MELLVFKLKSAPEIGGELGFGRNVGGDTGGLVVPVNAGVGFSFGSAKDAEISPEGFSVAWLKSQNLAGNGDFVVTFFGRELEVLTDIANLIKSDGAPR